MLEGYRQSFQPTWQRFAMGSFNAFRDLFERHQFGSCALYGSGNHGLGQRSRAATFMTNEQTAQPLILPGVSPVVDGLGAHLKFFGNVADTPTVAEQQQAQSTGAEIRIGMFARQLL